MEQEYLREEEELLGAIGDGPIVNNLLEQLKQQPIIIILDRETVEFMQGEAPLQ